jgi:hypothetical protein
MVHIIVKVEDTLAQQFGPLDNYMLFSVIEKVKIIYIYIKKKKNERKLCIKRQGNMQR